VVLMVDSINCPGLHQHDGGHSFNGGVVFPLEEDQPPVTADEAVSWAAYARYLLLCIAALLAAVLAALAGMPNLFK